MKVPASPLPEKIKVEKAQEVIFQPNPGPQTDFLSSTEQEVLYGGAAGGGKVVWEYQSILTPDGWQNCKDLTVGDTICDPEGGTQKIIYLFDWEELPVWEVEFDDGTVFDTAEEHLWEYRIAQDRKNRTRVASTKDMRDHMVRRDRKAIIRTVKEIDFTPQSVDINPYFLGCLLGDGCITTPQFTYSTHEEDWEHYRVEWSLNEKEVIQKGQTVRFVGNTRKNIWELLGHYGLQNTNSETKFVPNEYLFNTKSIRLSLLQGLMDTDGYRDPQRARAEYSTVSPKLKDAVVFLARSLGYRVSVYEKQGSYLGEGKARVSCKKAYRVYITGENVDNLFKLKRKHSGTTGKQVGRRVVEIRKTDRKATGRCITVSADHNLYVTDDFVVTHNSYAMLADPVRFFNNSKASMLLLRRSTEELRELVNVSKQLYPKAIPGIKFSERDKTWTAPSGATLWMSFLDRDDDANRYQGQAYNWIGFDELTQWPSPYPWNYLRSRLRTPKGSGLDLYQRATTNPGGAGHQWVKKMFVDPEKPGTSFWATDPETGEVLRWPENSTYAQEHGLAGQPMFKRKFIPSTLFDNPYLSHDGVYEANLLSLPEHQRRQLLEGDWTINEGAAFPEFNMKVHVVEPFDIPNSWTKFRACDYGYSSHTGVLWFAISPSEQIIVYRELYCSGVLATDLADMVLEAEYEERVKYGVLDSSLWHKRGDTGPSLAEQMIIKGCRWRPSDRSAGSRVAGKNEIHRRLQIDEFTEEPRMVIFDTCKNLIQQLPMIPLDKNNPEDVDTKAEDHLYDALRYGLMSRPKSALHDYYSITNMPSFNPSDKVFGY